MSKPEINFNQREVELYIQNPFSDIEILILKRTKKHILQISQKLLIYSKKDQMKKEYQSR